MKSLIRAILIGVAVVIVLAGCGGRTAAAPEAAAIDVIVIGAGGAGMAAAVEAAEAGATVVLLEKMPMVGGNTMRATGGINAAGTSVQAGHGITDTPDLFYDDAFRGGREMNDPELLRILADESAGAVEWLIEHGADLSDVGRLGGHSVNRSHRPTGGAPVGATVVTTLQRAATARNVDIRLWNEVTDLIIEDGRVVGVEVTVRDGSTEQIRAGAVIIAAGGFGANNDMVARYDEDLRGFGTTNHPGADGAIIGLVAERANAALLHMEQIQTHPTVVPADGTMVTEAVRGNGAILVSRTGRRFANELGTRDVVSDATLAQPEGTAFLLFDHSVRESLRAIENYIRQGIVIQGDSLEALAGEAGINATVLAQTVATYNQAVAAGTDAEFGRSDMPRSLNEGAFYAVEVGPGVHHTMGGIRINPSTQVLNGSGAPIPGLYAAGEVTGGIHGANRLGGNALADLIVFGRIAGREAAAFAAAK
ncbi:MAG: flavocytochrome c [Spirochaetaceae bacterium]|nr:MAG: flavocytochrome c [Spirochaetaceae bacterium]